MLSYYIISIITIIFSLVYVIFFDKLNKYNNCNMRTKNINSISYRPSEFINCNVKLEVIDKNYGRLVNTITPNYWLLGLKIFAIILGPIKILIDLVAGTKSAQFRWSELEKVPVFILLILLIIVMAFVLYHVWLMTRKVQLYEKGFKILGIKGVECFYNEFVEIQKNNEYETGTSLRPQMLYHMKKHIVYIIRFKSKDEIILRKRHYLYLESKIEDVKGEIFI